MCLSRDLFIYIAGAVVVSLEREAPVSVTLVHLGKVLRPGVSLERGIAL
ncbi:hypothetical protein HOV35_gp32 [Escherichia phage Sortsne]|uniref:Uncharacterized protein n=1 Tax=Escherichia phage Sortsne TaxID=2562456 RepID=A0A4D6DYX8_9CAUD|nr:hypothetical protein HOV35_gp32 [Escherichia phage Sortsne]QBZ71597.1 hypothetical protein [Escherichia phage Sortsne]